LAKRIVGAALLPPSGGLPRRKLLRLKGFDYAEPGCSYFVTICAAERGRPLLGTKVIGAIKESIQRIRDLGALVHCYCIMPDHLHFLISLSDSGKSLPNLIRGFKYRVSRAVGRPIWQRSYYDHILRPSEEAEDICRYILENPIRKGLACDFDQWPHAEMLDAL